MLSETGEVIFTTVENFDDEEFRLSEIRSFDLSENERIIGVRYYDTSYRMNYQVDLQFLIDYIE